jgi:hypothetical protein
MPPPRREPESAHQKLTKASSFRNAYAARTNREQRCTRPRLNHSNTGLASSTSSAAQSSGAFASFGAQRSTCDAVLGSTRAPVVHGDRAALERLRRDQLEPSRARQTTLVQGRAVADDPGVDEELVLVDQIQPV